MPVVPICALFTFDDIKAATPVLSKYLKRRSDWPVIKQAWRDMWLWNQATSIKCEDIRTKYQEEFNTAWKQVEAIRNEWIHRSPEEKNDQTLMNEYLENLTSAQADAIIVDNKIVDEQTLWMTAAEEAEKKFQDLIVIQCRCDSYFPKISAFQIRNVLYNIIRDEDGLPTLEEVAAFVLARSLEIMNVSK